MKQLIQGFFAGIMLLIMIPCVLIGFLFKQIKTGFKAGIELADELNDFITDKQ